MQQDIQSDGVELQERDQKPPKKAKNEVVEWLKAIVIALILVAHPLASL